MNSSSNPLRILAAAAVGMVSLASSGCYLLGSARGQLALMSRREPISSVIARPSTPAALRTQLRAVSSIRDFASRELKLPDNGSYRSYADVGRRYVVWTIVAAPEFSVDAREWCYPIVGCVSYRGYFSDARARSFAAGLRARHFDVALSGVEAYSTLGHFDDPILNTMVGWSDIDLAAIVFHELTHQWLYLAGDASFNEALATTVEEEGLRRWLLSQGRNADWATHVQQQSHFLAVVELLRRTRSNLRSLYASGLDQARLREGKRVEFQGLRGAFSALKAGWGGRAPFESWFEGDVNNAHLASIATYYDCVPGFQRELAAAHGDLDEFFRQVKTLSRQSREARDAVLCGRS